MTYEELKAEAKRQGYDLVKRPTYIPLSKCSCGANLSVRAIYTTYGKAYKCIKCGLEGNPHKTQIGARKLWNEEVEKAKINGANKNGK